MLKHCCNTKSGTAEVLESQECNGSKSFEAARANLLQTAGRTWCRVPSCGFCPRGAPARNCARGNRPPSSARYTKAAERFDLRDTTVSQRPLVSRCACTATAAGVSARATNAAVNVYVEGVRTRGPLGLVARASSALKVQVFRVLRVRC